MGETTPLAVFGRGDPAFPPDLPPLEEELLFARRDRVCKKELRRLPPAGGVVLGVTLVKGKFGRTAVGKESRSCESRIHMLRD